MDGYSKRQDAFAKQTDRLNHILGWYIATGVNQPDKYRDKPVLAEDNKMEYTPETFRDMAKRRWGKKE